MHLNTLRKDSRAITKIWASIYFEQEELKEQEKKFKREQEQNNG